MLSDWMPSYQQWRVIFGVKRGKKPLVLLVDDEQDLCTLMQMCLSRMGIDSHIAYRLQEAVQAF